MRNKNTLFVGKVFLHFPTLESTNQYALELLAKSRPTEGTAISTDDQVAGRGQVGRRWVSEAGKNISVSIIFYPSFLPVRRQFLLNQAIALAVADCLAVCTEAPVSVKWPNDIYIDNRKVAGILIQNNLSGSRFQSSVVGIGINVNQRIFPEDLPNPTSLRLENDRDVDRQALRSDLFHHLEVRYLQLRQGHYDVLQSAYRERLYRLDSWALFKRAGGPEFYGCIRGITDEGKLLVEKENHTSEAFDLQSVIFL